jgi:NADH-quinone oxidoreductase subunit F
LGETLSEASLCGLGQACSKPALSTLKYFLKEYEDHIREHRCAGAVCDSMVISACQHACPAGIDVPNYVAAVAEGDYEKSVDIIRERNPFPAVCGRICIHPCEYKCRRGELDQPVAIRAIKRLAADWYFQNIGSQREPFEVTRKEKIAIVGAGPAGLTCAYFLAKMGYRTTVFESQSVAGGMLGIAVPEFRLPQEVIEQEIQYIENCGVEIQYNSPIDAKHTFNDLLDEGYGAVFIAAGAQASKRIGIPGEEEGLEGLYYGLDFLNHVRVGKEINLSGKTVIIGETGGICPVTNCHKGLVNGPCGGTNHGKCEIDVDKDCVWTLIYTRLNELGQLDSMRKYQKPRNHLDEPKPGKLKLAKE